MKRRTLFKTLFGASIATALGLEKAVAKEEGIIYAPYIPVLKESFMGFFKRINGFEMNADQYNTWFPYQDNYSNGCCAYRQSGMTTFIATLARWEAEVNHKNVGVLTNNNSTNNHMFNMIAYPERARVDLVNIVPKYGGYIPYGPSNNRLRTSDVVRIYSDTKDLLGLKLDVLLTDNFSGDTSDIIADRKFQVWTR